MLGSYRCCWSNSASHPAGWTLDFHVLPVACRQRLPESTKIPPVSPSLRYNSSEGQRRLGFASTIPSLRLLAKTWRCLNWLEYIWDGSMCHAAIVRHLDIVGKRQEVHTAFCVSLKYPSFLAIDRIRLCLKTSASWRPRPAIQFYPNSPAHLAPRSPLQALPISAPMSSFSIPACPKQTSNPK